MQARTTVEELRLAGKAVTEKLNRARGPVEFIVPLKSWSSFSVKGQPLYGPGADRILVEELRKQIQPKIEVRELDMHLNTPGFAIAVAIAFEEMMKGKGEPKKQAFVRPYHHRS